MCNSSGDYKWWRREGRKREKQHFIINLAKKGRRRRGTKSAKPISRAI